MRRPLYTVVAVSISLASVSLPFYAGPAAAQDRPVDQLLKHEDRFDSANVVSTAFSRGGNLFLDTIRAAAATRRADWARGDIQIATLGGTLLIWQTIPSWLAPQEEPHLRDYRPILDEFLTKEVELAGDLATLTGEYSHQSVGEVFVAVFRDAPNNLYEKRRTMTMAMLDKKDTKVQLYLNPSIFFYAKDGTYLGHTHYWKGEATFEAERVDPKGVATYNWYKAPTKIEPQFELTPQDAARAVTLTPREGERTLGNLAQELNGQGVKFAPIDDKVAGLSLFIAQRKDWTAGELLRSVCAVGGVELRKTADGYAFGTSPAHEEVGRELYFLAQARHEQQETLKKVFGIYTRNGNKLELPFASNLFMSQAPISIENLGPAVKTEALSHLDEATRHEVGQVWFVLNVTLGLHGEKGSSVGFALTPFPAAYNLNPPADWKGFDVANLQETYGAKVTF